SLSLLHAEQRGPTPQEMDVLLALAHLATLAITHTDLQNELFHRAHHDSLTQLPNRRLCEERTGEAIARARRHQRKVGMLCIDLDEFKQVNDLHGHEAGDFLLQTIAVRLIGRLRATDTLARLGGDEFLVVVDDIREGEDLEKVAESLRTTIAEPVRFKNALLRITASIGGALYPNDGKTTEELKQHADHAMYRAKERGRNTFQMFSVELSERLARRRQLEGYLRDALDQHGFELYYQPQYTLKRELIGLEALLRFRAAPLQAISPAEFIPVAEQTGLILEVGEWVVRSVCRQGKEWLDQGFAPVRLSINISPLELVQDRFAERVAEAIHDSGFDPKYLQIEVTETAVMSNMEEAGLHLQQLERLGVAVSVDDFGTGHSSLSYLHRLPIDSIKVDSSFVRQITHCDESAAIVRAIVAMANSLGLQVIAEGVETEDQLSAVAKLGCQFVQGYVFSQPLAIEAIPAILAARARPGAETPASIPPRAAPVEAVAARQPRVAAG
ncbi:MAG: EAL domain-containing protein, partial [Candidatus Korobacteraceae bacterium]